MANVSAATSRSLFYRLGLFLRSELAPFPGRLDAAVRIMLCVGLCMLISMSLNIPFLMLSVIMIFFTQQANPIITLMVGLFLLAGALIVSAIDIALLAYTFDYPAVRIIVTCVLVFIGMYFFRISPVVGAMGYMVALCVVLSQSVYAMLPFPELIVRATLWALAVDFYSVGVTVAVNFLVRPADPRKQLYAELIRQANAAVEQFEARLSGLPAREIPQQELERGITVLQQTLKFSTLMDKRFRTEKVRLLLTINNFSRLHMAAANISRLAPMEMSQSAAWLLGLLRGECLALRESVEKKLPFHLKQPIDAEKAARGLAATPASLAAELHEIMSLLQDQDRDSEVALMEVPKEKSSLLAPDAFSNPAYAQFAFKTTLSTMLCYFFYTAVQWDGIHTCMLTCIILALPSLGEVRQKGILRIAGCGVGSLITLLAIVFVIPHLDSIVGFMALSLPVMLLAGWINAGSARSNYAGMQIAFAFALALFEQYGPNIGLTEVRDRLVGVLVGVSVYTMVSMLIWPEKGTVSLRKTMAELLRGLADLAAAGADQGDGGTVKARTALEQGCALLGACREMQSRVILEPDWSYGGLKLNLADSRWITRAQEALFALNRLQTLHIYRVRFGHLSVEELRLGDEFFAYAAHRLEIYAQWLEDPERLKEIGPGQVEVLRLPPDLAAFLDRARADARQRTSKYSAEGSGGDDFKREACLVQELLEMLDPAELLQEPEAAVLADESYA